MKFNIDDYKGKYVMHCKTREEARSFCDYFRREKNPRSYYGEIHPDIFQSKTAYNFNEELIGDGEFYSSNGYKVLEWSDFMSDTVTNKDRINKVFEILGVKPYECFNLSGDNSLYYIDYELNLHCRTLNDEYKLNNHESNDMIVDILREKETIVFYPTKEEQLAIDYARALGCKWIAKDKDGLIYAFTEKPYKMTTVWNVENGEHYVIQIPISFIHWDDEEPYYIGD